MNLLNPAALAWGAIAMPIVALYVLRVRRRRQVVPTLMFWDRIFQDTVPRSLWRRLRHLLSLLMQLGFAALLVLALADPVGSGASGKPVHTIIVVDRSASMQTTDGDPTRFDQAKAIAHRAIRSMRSSDQATIIAAGPHPVIACGRTYHQPTLHDAVDSLTFTDAPAATAQALTLARSITVGEQERRVVLLTDHQGATELEVKEDETLTVHRCGGDMSNVAITGFAIRPRADNPAELQGMLRVANFSADDREAQIRIEEDGTLTDLVVLQLAAGEEHLHRFALEHKGQGEIRARLTADDALMVDNQAVALLPAASEKTIALVTAGNLFLESVLRSLPWMEVIRVEPATSDDAVNNADIIVFDGHVPDPLPARPCLYVNPADDSPLWTLGDAIDNPIVSDLAEDSPLLNHVNLRNVTFHRARAVTPRKEAKAVIASFEHPLLLRWASASPPAVLLAVDINQSDLPWRTAFPILMQNVLNDLAGRNADTPSAYRTGESASMSATSDAVTAADEQDHAVPVATAGEEATIGPVLSSGIVTVRSGGESKSLAFNLANRDESNTRAVSVDGEVQTDEFAITSVPTASWPWWITLAIAAIALSTVEWCLYQRRAID